jgi:hypothetical protein
MHKSPDAAAVAAAIPGVRLAKKPPPRSAVATSAQALPEREERQRRRMVTLVYVLFWLLVFEGSIRKYVVPQYGTYVFFIRDPFLMLLYLMALQAKVFRKPTTVLVVGMAFAALSIPLWFVQYMQYPVDKGPLLAVYGWRNYFAYIPLMFVVPRIFAERDLKVFAHHVALGMLINAPLMMAQFASPGGHWLNAGVAEDTALQFKQLSVSSWHVRASGTFTGVIGPTHLTALAAAFTFASWARSSSKRLYSPPVLYVTAVCICLSLAFAGSRGNILLVCGILAIGAMSSLLLRGGVQRTKMLVLPPSIAISFFTAYPILFPEAFKTFAERWTGANVHEGGSAEFGWISRFTGGILHPLGIYDEVPPTGFGLGLAGNAATILGVTIDGRPLPYTEVDWARQLVDLGPVIGTAFVIFRVAVGIMLVTNAIRATRRLSDPLPMTLGAYSGLVIAQDQITGNGTVCGFAWLVGGLATLAASVRSDDAGSNTSMERSMARNTKPR